MEKRFQRKGDGWSRKIREKRRKLVEESAMSWHSTKDFFAGATKPDNKSNKNSNQPTGQNEE